MSDDRAALEELNRVSDVGTPHVVLHYLYFPSKATADEVAARLGSQGFTTECRLGADGISWLVLAKHEIVPSEHAMSTARELVEELADAADGEYDGWEAEVPCRSERDVTS